MSDEPKAARKRNTSQAKLPAEAADPSASPLYVQSVEKAMKVLTAFDGSKRQLSLSEISASTGFDMSATQRFTYTLAALGYLFKDADSRKYELSPRLLDFTYHYLTSNDLVSRATPYLQQLGSETEEATNLTVLDDTDIVFVLRIVSRNVFNAHVITGSRLPAYCTAPGLAILATLPDGEIDDILSRTNLVAYTASTVCQPRKIKERIVQIRKQGYAHTEDEYFVSDISTAAAITNAHGRGIGAVNIAVARSRWQADRDEKRFADLVISTASAISTRRRIE
ncbi:IclR family transcriptional regulator [Paraburkholderia sp. GV068]|jgi:DNA-binding IclR family transcriptional regulator|uniref:IclR family transcriptional regulator n=1 Tax=Paraburkholderia TaxID=1822464 RepID=UPI000D2F9C83|nr:MULTISPECIES: IclR family transcriptional regulator [Paraburkholderia]AXF07718.1 IclR family transcriptional regulator [Paraburkholderia graminis]MDR6466455.1 DNA-binding IclR family transcriptional regulator [Paraburkholderia graminis]MDR6474269.1 DNA-binding IclR family transcriptional regulator [Paraburkholderia graminis]PTQ98576.1 IclR family transcriptional regulator [Paraburkholderia sp. GV072]PUB03819.1 IclR family transcriptional regulator [Paraburkholderia sp. GV068]